MENMDILTQKVKDGITHHNATCSGACSTCPYKESNAKCTRMMLNDVNEVIDYWKGKYESTLLATPPMILRAEPEFIKIESVDIRSTLKYIKTMERMEKVAKKATEALNEANEAILALKEEVRKFDSK